jgi:hypothetical protein
MVSAMHSQHRPTSAADSIRRSIPIPVNGFGGNAVPGSSPRNLKRKVTAWMGGSSPPMTVKEKQEIL